MLTRLLFRGEQILLGDNHVTVYSDKDKITALRTNLNTSSNDFLTILKSIKSDSHKVEAVQAWNFPTSTTEDTFVDLISNLETELIRIKAIDAIKPKVDWNPTTTTFFKLLPSFKSDVFKIELLETLDVPTTLDFKIIVAIMESLVEDEYKIEALDCLTPTQQLNQLECEYLIKLITSDHHRHQAIRRIRLIYTECEGYKFNHLLTNPKYMLEVPAETTA